MSKQASHIASRSACLKAATAEAKRYRAQTCKAQVKMGKGTGRTMTAPAEEVEAAHATKGANTTTNRSGSGSNNSSSSGNSTASSSKYDGFPKSLPNSTYDERIAFMNVLLAQGEQGTLGNGTSACSPWVAYFDFTVQLMTYMMGNIGSGIGRMAGTSVGLAAGASIGQSAGLVTGAAASTVLMPAEEAALGQVTGPGVRSLKQRGVAKSPQEQERQSHRQRRRQRQQQSAQPVDDATIGLAGASGVGLGTGFAIGTPAGAAAGRQYGEKIGKEVAVWVINNTNFAIAYFGTLILAELMNGIDLVVTDGITRVTIEKIIRSHIQDMEDKIFQDFTVVYNATVYEDYSNLELESAVFQSIVGAFRGMGVLFGFAGGMPVGAAVGASSGGIYGSGGAGAASGAARAGSMDKETERKAQAASSSSVAEEIAAIDPLVANAAAMWMATSIGVGSGTAIGVGGGIYGGWTLSTEIGYAMGLLMVKGMVKGLALFQQSYGQVVLDQIEEAIFQATRIRINITYTPTCDFSNYTYPIKNISSYIVESPLDDVTGGRNESGKKAGGSAAAAAPNRGDGGDKTADWSAALLQLLGKAATAVKLEPPASSSYSRTAASFFQTAAVATGTKAQQIRSAYDACQSYAISEMYRQKSLCYLNYV